MEEEAEGCEETEELAEDGEGEEDPVRHWRRPHLYNVLSHARQLEKYALQLDDVYLRSSMHFSPKRRSFEEQSVHSSKYSLHSRESNSLRNLQSSPFIFTVSVHPLGD